MSFVLNSGIRKNGATRICLPRPPRLAGTSPRSVGHADTLPRLTMPALAPLPCPAFNRPRMGAASLQHVLRLWAGCSSDTEAHQLACRVILGVQSGAIEVAEEVNW